VELPAIAAYIRTRGDTSPLSLTTFDFDFSFLEFQQTDTMFHRRPEDREVVKMVLIAADPDTVVVVSNHGIGRGLRGTSRRDATRVGPRPDDEATTPARSSGHICASPFITAATLTAVTSGEVPGLDGAADAPVLLVAEWDDPAGELGVRLRLGVDTPCRRPYLGPVGRAALDRVRTVDVGRHRLDDAPDQAGLVARRDDDCDGGTSYVTPILRENGWRP